MCIYHLGSSNVNIWDNARVNLLCTFLKKNICLVEDSLSYPCCKTFHSPPFSPFPTISFGLELYILFLPSLGGGRGSGVSSLLAKAIPRFLIALLELVQKWGSRKWETRWRAILLGSLGSQGQRHSTLRMSFFARNNVTEESSVCFCAWYMVSLRKCIKF